MLESPHVPHAGDEATYSATSMSLVNILGIVMLEHNGTKLKSRYNSQYRSPFLCDDVVGHHAYGVRELLPVRSPLTHPRLCTVAKLSTHHRGRCTSYLPPPITMLGPSSPPYCSLLSDNDSQRSLEMDDDATPREAREEDVREAENTMSRDEEAEKEEILQLNRVVEVSMEMKPAEDKASMVG